MFLIATITVRLYAGFHWSYYQVNVNALDLIALAEEVELIIQTTIPKSSRIQKYGGTLFTLKPDEKEGQFCGVFIYKHHVQISFSKGARLQDEKKILSGSGKLRRYMNFATIDEIDLEATVDLLVQASKV